MSKILFGSLFAAFCLLALCGTVAAQQTTSIQPGAVLRWDQIVAADVSRPSVPEPEREINPPMPGPLPVGLESPQSSKSEGVNTPAPVGRISRGIISPDVSKVSGSPIINFQALPDNNTVIPPDTHGAVGTTYVMTMLNSQVRIQSKTGTVISTVSLSSFWSPLTGVPFDPRVFYDSLSGRWVATCGGDGGLSTSKIFFAISSTGDPTGVWTFYSIVADAGGTSWADYPCVGMNARWVAISANMYTVSGSSFLGVKMWVIDKSSALAGGALTITTFATGFDAAGGASGFTLQPAITYGTDTTLYIVDNRGYYRSSDTTFLLRISRLTGTGSSPVWSVMPGSIFSGSGLFLVANNYNASQVNAPQLGTSTLINTNDNRILNSVFRNGRIWLTHSAGLPPKIAPTPNRTAVFWYQLNPTAMPSPIVQSGALDGGSGVHYFFPSIAANTSNDACVGFTRSDATRYAEGVFTGRQASDPVNTMQGITLMKAGKSSYSKFFSGTRNRWGDYSATVVDPSDGKTFWHIEEYADSNVGSGVNDGRWGTWWGRIDPLISLPIQLANFDASVLEGNNVELEWSTVSEVNNYGFYIERRREDSQSFEELPGSFVPGNGTTLEPHSYNWKDENVPPGAYFYRVRQVDLDGLLSYSSVVKIVLSPLLGVGTDKNLPREYKLMPNYPNPFNPSTTIRYELKGNSRVLVRIYNILGELVATLVDRNEPAGSKSVRWNASSFPSGFYFYRLDATNLADPGSSFVQVRKMMYLK